MKRALSITKQNNIDSSKIKEGTIDSDDFILVDLMKRSQEGDKGAYSELLEKLIKILKNYFEGKMPQFSDDIVQDTLISIHKARHTFDPSRPFRPWLFAIAKRRLIDFQRMQIREKKRTESLQTSISFSNKLEQAEEYRNTGNLSEPNDNESKITSAVEMLSTKQQDVIKLLKLEGFSIDEVAEKLSLSNSNVKVIAHRAYEKLRQILTN